MNGIGITVKDVEATIKRNYPDNWQTVMKKYRKHHNRCCLLGCQLIEEKIADIKRMNIKGEKMRRKFYPTKMEKVKNFFGII